MDHFFKQLKKNIFSYNKYYNGNISDHFNGEYFYNIDSKNNIGFKEFIKWKLFSKPKIWPKSVLNKFEDTPPSKVYNNDLRVSWIGHSSFLIQTQGLNFLLDPIYQERASPFKIIGPKRVCAPGIKFENLPKIDILLITHNHYDHLDLNTIQRIWKRDKPLIVTPLGNDKIIHKYNSKIEVITRDLYDVININQNIKIALEPAIHWSARGLFDKNRSLWATFVIIIDDGCLYLVGDTAYGSHFKKAKSKYKKFRFAILPIGAYEPRWFMKQSHINYEEAIIAYNDLDRPYTVPSHYKTYQLTDEGYDDPLSGLYKSFKKYDMDESRFHPLNIGQYWYVPTI